MTNRTRRIILVLIAPAVLQLLTVLAATLYFGNGATGDQSLAFVAVLLSSVTLAAVLLGHDSFDRFWKVYAFSCTVSALPIVLLTALIAIIKGTQGYFWLGLTLLAFLILVVTLVSLPVTYLVYVYLRNPNADT
jgi:hypothetical protein